MTTGKPDISSLNGCDRTPSVVEESRKGIKTQHVILQHTSRKREALSLRSLRVPRSNSSIGQCIIQLRIEFCRRKYVCRQRVANDSTRKAIPYSVKMLRNVHPSPKLLTYIGEDSLQKYAVSVSNGARTVEFCSPCSFTYSTYGS